jgi:general stress protein YciG
VISGRFVAPPLHLMGSPESACTEWREHPGDGRREHVAKEDRGFASMDRAKQREIASKGGKAAHQKGTAHEWTSEEARDAGRKGGLASHKRRREQMLSSEPGSGDSMENQDDMRGDSGNEIENRRSEPTGE